MTLLLQYVKTMVDAGAVVLFLLVPQVVASQDSNPSSPAMPVMTNFSRIWTIPMDQRTNEVRVQTEALIYYYDKEWSVCWGESSGSPTWFPVMDSPVPFKAGQRIAFDGVVSPIHERFIWSKTRWRVLAEDEKLPAETVSNLTDHPAELKAHRVSVEGLIDGMSEDATHLTLNFLGTGAKAMVYVLKETNAANPRLRVGDFIRLQGVYMPQFDLEGQLSDLALWVARPQDIQKLGSLEHDSRFDLPVTPVAEIDELAQTNSLLHVRGFVRSREAGKWLTLWDGTGQVMVQTRQMQPLRFGDEVDAIGYPFVQGVQQCLRDSWYRPLVTTNDPAAVWTRLANQVPLRLAEQVRDLSREAADQHLPVKLRAFVTWSHEATPFAFVQDGSGGIRLMNPKWDERKSAKPGTIVEVQGVTAAGDFVPVVTNAIVLHSGWWNPDDPRPVTLEQALTGVEDGEWVEMRGFVQEMMRTNGLVSLHLSTASGEFQAWAPGASSLDNLRGSIIQVRGVCAVVPNARHQITGIQVWSPDPKYIQVEESAPDNLFSVDFRPAGDLRRFNLQNALNQRVRTAGTVVLQVPGRYLYVQDGVDSVLALSQQRDVLRPGDRVEVVGFPGNQGRKFLLREAVYRRLAGGSEPTPVALPPTQTVNPDLDGRLAQTSGTLLNVMEGSGEARLLIQTPDAAFEARLDASAARPADWPHGLSLGSTLALTGVYEVQADEYGQPRSFWLHLRSGDDVRVLQQPPWWTLARMVWVLVAVLAVFLFALVWGVMMARKNTLLDHARRELQTANDQLENRVTERTRELQAQVAAEGRARNELAQAQRELMVASRQAGMAEVATSVLHNVGNVLNSINVSTTVLREQIRDSGTRPLLKVADLLRQHEPDASAFLAADPKGKMVPKFICQIAGQLQKEQENSLRELDQLAKNVDHIKDVVSMQQSYARVAGVFEKTSLATLVDDALQINADGLARRGIKVLRRFEDVPPVTMDRHKVLQILINLVRNAEYALEDGAPREKQIIATVARAGAEHVLAQIADNGVGIPPENLTRIFSYGFTTRADGHGFGLHLGALNAQEMGGSLTASSDGVGRGATFALVLPANPPGS